MFLSIIIPVYNVEKYLDECIKSCLEQDIPYSEYEIICVNDGSTDGSSKILDKYQANYPNVKVIYQINSGVSVARNTGIDEAKGDYIWFVDSDDFIQENVLNKLYLTTLSSNIDRLAFGHFEFEDALSAEEFSKYKAHTLRPTAASLGYVIWESLYKRSFLNDNSIRFREGIHYAEDGLFCYEVNYCRPNVVSLDESLYFYRRNNSSVTRTNSIDANKKRIQSAYKIAKIQIQYTLKDVQTLTANQASYNVVCGVLMPDVRTITIATAQLPVDMRRELLGKLAENKLFPLFLYKKPRDWFPKKIHMNHAYMGLKGKVLDVLNFYSTTRIGFAMLVLFNKIRGKV